MRLGTGNLTGATREWRKESHIDICAEKLESSVLSCSDGGHQLHPRNSVILFYTSEWRRWVCNIQLNKEVGLWYTVESGGKFS